MIAKPSQQLADDTPLSVEAPPRFVSRGGDKLEAFLKNHPVSIAGTDALDVGASTGGFTDCLLQYGAAHVTCVDVGRAQLHARLRADPRVVNLEKINARRLHETKLPREQYDVAVVDVSFISLKKILPAAWARVRPDGALIALVKPQFEATKTEASAVRGVIRDAAIHQRVLREIRDFALAELPGAKIFGEMPSPLLGGDGNREFLLGLRK